LGFGQSKANYKGGSQEDEGDGESDRFSFDNLTGGDSEVGPDDILWLRGTLYSDAHLLLVSVEFEAVVAFFAGEVVPNEGQ
jgi:hypothetical protein